MKSTSTSPPESGVMIVAIERVLRQITRMVVGRLAFPKYFELLRKIYVEEAERDLIREGGRKNVPLSELGLVTGIDTRTLSKVRDSADYMKPITESASFFTDLTPEAAVVDRWRTDPTFTDPTTKSPRELIIWGEAQTFESLVQSTVKSRGITVQSILNRLSKSGLVSMSESGESITLKPGRWMPYQTTDETAVMQSGLLGVSKHLDTVLNNIESVARSVEPRIERIFFSNRLDPSRLEEFRSKMHEFLEIVSDESVKQIEPFDSDFELRDPISGGVGFYYFDSEIS